MISSILGAVIMSAATISMLIAINLANNNLKNSGKYPLTLQEREILTNAGYKLSDIELINQEIEMLDLGDLK